MKGLGKMRGCEMREEMQTTGRERNRGRGRYID